MRQSAARHWVLANWMLFMFKQFRLCAVVAVFLAGPVQSQDLPSVIELGVLAATDPTTALPQIDAALGRLAAQENADVRLQFDLVRLKIDLLTDQGAGAEAAGLTAELASFAATHRDALQRDPAVLWAEAAMRFEELGLLEEAFDLREVLLAEYRDGARAPQVLIAALEDLALLARLLGDTVVAERFDQQIAALRTQIDTNPNTATNSTGALENPFGLRGEAGGFRAVDAYYATDRDRTGSTQPSEFYGGGRGELEMGIATVTIPHGHTPGVLEAPSIWRLEFRENPAKHVVLQSVEPMDPDSFFGRMQSEFVVRPEREALVFVHGYNVSFDGAARRAAQLAHDMRYVGVPILYSWPSRGSTTGYVADTAVVRLSARRLTGFLDDIVERSGAQVVHLVAHSMGNRALTDALELMALRRDVQADDPPIFGQILFAAPDVDAGLFRAMLPTIQPLAQRLTLYASEEDWALTVSRKLHGNVPRAGLGGPFTLRDPLIDSIDMSELGEDMLAHSYFADDSSALADMMTLFWQNTNPARRCGLREQSGEVSTWRYQRGQCEDRNLVDLLAHMRASGVSTMAEARSVLREKVEDKALAGRLETVLADIVSE